MKIVNRISSYHKSTIETRIIDLHPLLEEQLQNGKSVVVLNTDNCPDWNVNYIVNMFFFFFVYGKTKLDALLVNLYCPGLSTHNPIEHAWAPLSRALSSVILPASLPSESVAPWRQKLLKKDMQIKEVQVFDHAMQKLDKYWNTVTFDNYNVNNTHQKCHVPNEPYNDYEDIHNELSKSASRIRENEQLMRQLSLCLKHVVRKLHCLFIKKCKSDDCSLFITSCKS